MEYLQSKLKKKCVRMLEEYLQHLRKENILVNNDIHLSGQLNVCLDGLERTKYIIDEKMCKTDKEAFVFVSRSSIVESRSLPSVNLLNSNKQDKNYQPKCLVNSQTETSARISRSKRCKVQVQSPCKLEKHLNLGNSKEISSQKNTGDYNYRPENIPISIISCSFFDNEQKKRTRNNKNRNVLWYNPPFNLALKTNIGKTFLKLIDKHFPKNHQLNKIINRKNVKISYSCCPNIQNIINSNNRKFLTINNKQ